MHLVWGLGWWGGLRSIGRMVLGGWMVGILWWDDTESSSGGWWEMDVGVGVGLSGMGVGGADGIP